MITIRHIERLFDEQQYRKLYHELMTGRPEAQAELHAELGRVVPLAAMGMIRLDELTQSHAPLYRRFLGVVLTSQQSDGGWGDPSVTALCLRALMCGGGQGRATASGLAHLATLQKSEGIWPREPFRRMPADALVSAFILLQLGDRAEFRSAVRFDDAVDWFAVNAQAMDPAAKNLWSHAAVRCRLTPANARISTLWSHLNRSAA
jgi:hypothetical protein